MLLETNSFVLTWQNQNNVKSYEVNINDVEYSVETNSFDFASVLTTGIQNIKVRALSNNMFTNDSDWSETKTIVLGETQLGIPSVIQMPQESNNYTLGWGSITGADFYVVGIKSENGKEKFIQTTKTNLSIMEHMSNGGEYLLKVRAMAYDYVTYAPSNYCEDIEYTCPLPLTSPTNLVISGKTLSWDDVDNAYQYRVTNESGQSMTTGATTADISELLNSNNAKFLFVQAISDGTAQDSAYSDGIGIYPSLGSSSMQRQAYGNSKFKFMGQEFDLVIDSTQEMKLLCYYALYYRITNTEMYVNYNTNVGDEVLNYLSEYNEIKSISYSMRGPVVHNSDTKYVITIDYSHVALPINSSTGDLNPVQLEGVKPLNYTKVQNGDTNKRASNYNDFAVNSRVDEMLVFTTDQLYYALQSGCKPKFASTTTMAYKAYERAKEILREIIDNGMSEYEKALAIYEWLVYNTEYDSSLLKLSGDLEGSRDDAIRSSASATLSNYKGFYIDGVLFDKGKAVCDGISKTFVLLCNIEGIECIKVSGDAGGAHAWNKIKIKVPSQTEKKWFTVDATWADITDSDKNEWLTHRYFLKTDTQMSDHIEDPASGYVSNTTFNYYENTIIATSGSTNIDLYVENDAELTTLLNYIISWNANNSNEEITGIEFGYSLDMNTTIRARINLILAGYEHEKIITGGTCVIVFE